MLVTLLPVPAMSRDVAARVDQKSNIITTAGTFEEITAPATTAVSCQGARSVTQTPLRTNLETGLSLSAFRAST